MDEVQAKNWICINHWQDSISCGSSDDRLQDRVYKASYSICTRGILPGAWAQTWPLISTPVKSPAQKLISVSRYFNTYFTFVQDFWYFFFLHCMIFQCGIFTVFINVESHESFYDNWMQWGLHRWYEMSQCVGQCYRHQCVIIPQLQTNIRLTHISSCSTSWVPQYQLFGSAVDFFHAIFISIHCAVQVSIWFGHLYGKRLWFHISRQIAKCTHNIIIP